MRRKLLCRTRNERPRIEDHSGRLKALRPRSEAAFSFVFNVGRDLTLRLMPRAAALDPAPREFRSSPQKNNFRANCKVRAPLFPLLFLVLEMLLNLAVVKFSWLVG